MAQPRGGARILLGAYLLFFVYVALFPFHLTADRDAIQESLTKAVVSFYDAEGRRSVSLPDLGGNVILGIPLGFLLVAGGLVGSSLLRRVAASGLVGFLLASAAEIAQLLAPGRITSIFDVGGQVAGTLAGALAAHGLVGSGPLLPPALRSALRERPLIGLLGALLALLAADALYPYAVTLDVSTVWGNVKSSAWRPLDGLRAQPWHALVVDRVLPYAAAAILALEILARHLSVVVRVAISGLAVVFATGLELGKLLVEGRSLQTSTILLAAAGALLGIAVAPLIGPLTRGRSRWVLAAAGIALVAYHQLRPFDFAGSVAAIRARAATIEWVPFAAYLMAEPHAALFDIGKKVALGALLGVLLRGPHPSAAVIWTIMLAAGLEVGQLAEASRHTSLTDVLVLTAGAWLAGSVLARYPAVLDSR